MSDPVPTPAPSVALPSWFDGGDAPTARDLQTCIHCGLCLTACPTYRTLKQEPDSPRGRIYLMRGLAEGRIAPSDALVESLDQCLDCRACETVCPAGVPYSRMLEATRGQLARRWNRATPLRLLGHAVLRHVLPHRGRREAVTDLLRASQHGPLASLAAAAKRLGLLPRFASQGLEMTPPLAPRRERALERVAPALPAGARIQSSREGLVFAPAGAPRGVVAFHTTCVMESMYPAINREVVRLLVLAGVEVRVPAAQGCCGALHAHAGLREDAKRLADANARAFSDDCEFIVTHSAGCGAALREAGHLTGNTRTQSFSTRVRDVSEVLAHYGLPRSVTELRAPDGGPLRVTYHDACHLAHAQRVREAPRRLLRALPGVAFTELPQSDWCCGSAGVYNLTHPEMADAQLAGKLDAVASVAPHVVVASNPGCLLHMRRGAGARGTTTRFLHLVELLAEAYPPAAGSGA